MKENIKTELELSKEQLQDITGGCDQCLADIDTATQHQSLASSYNTLSKEARRQGNIGTALQHLNLATQHSRQAQNLLDVVERKGVHFIP